MFWSNINVMVIKTTLQISSHMLTCFLSEVCSLLMDARSWSH